MQLQYLWTQKQRNLKDEGGPTLFKMIWSFLQFILMFYCFCLLYRYLQQMPTMAYDFEDSKNYKIDKIASTFLKAVLTIWMLKWMFGYVSIWTSVCGDNVLFCCCSVKGVVFFLWSDGLYIFIEHTTLLKAEILCTKGSCW